jgi:TRAP-type uncharacterized transport system substrate-binding protein
LQTLHICWITPKQSAFVGHLYAGTGLHRANIDSKKIGNNIRDIADVATKRILITSAASGLGLALTLALALALARKFAR